MEAFLARVPDDARRHDCVALLQLMKRATKAKPTMWGPSIYLMAGFDRHTELLRKLGQHKTRKSCLYIKRLADIDMAVLREMVDASVEHIKRTYG